LEGQTQTAGFLARCPGNVESLEVAVSGILGLEDGLGISIPIADLVELVEDLVQIVLADLPAVWHQMGQET